ncbi:Asp-tRNA(Asn)/Glu-tRNA(Gln) amidotransferase subunit GatB [Roseivirga sp. BDSF3-8]|uniref:Asp-tRNA(Asn)/Glu-tRNA(Gln) amidotransferase subunit GatB n=1 Tax=Roseivirga sp. BDSF3-8 TaxID=3241598 RepID=UPI003531A872
MLEESVRNKYEAVIGLEVHAQMLTKSKMFASDSAEYGGRPNRHVSVITLGHPGTLPKPNRKAMDYAMRMGLACACEISRENIFDRKNYFYPDLPKGYQLTQDKTPICIGGQVNITLAGGQSRAIQLNRIHLEEDAGKSIHVQGEEDTLVDYNRAGVPLIEIVTEPDIHSSEEAYAFLTEVRRLVRYLDICDGNMEEGSLRCDANISIRPVGETSLGKKVEVKNMNSIRNVARAIDHEIERQIAETEKGNSIPSETRTFDSVTGTTAGMRTKEELNDYRYFPEPDISPLIVTDEWIEEVRRTMPSLPWELYERFTREYGLPDYDASVITDNKEFARYFEAICRDTTNYKSASNWMMGPVKSHLNDHGIHASELAVKPAQVATLINMVDENKVSVTAAQQSIFPALVDNPEKTPEQVAEELNLVQESNDDALLPIIREVLEANPDKVKAYQKGKKGLIGMFMGEVMKKSGGKADPKKTNELLRQELG